jgi:cation diffusion facilitator CzcD-associated flavoprotein CzcO
MPFPDDYPTYVPKDLLVRYYEDYARHFRIHPVFGKAVDDLERTGSTWVVTCTDGSTYPARAVIVAAGLNRVPFHPHFQDEEDYSGDLIHSHDYQHPGPYQGKKVLVVGMGNSGAEIALDLCEQGVQTAISVRGPVNIVPREILGRPTQVTALKLGKLPYWLGDRIGLVVRKLTVGDLPKYGIELPAISPARQLRETGQTPVIDLGTLDYVRSGELKIHPGINHFTNNGVVFTNGEEANFDVVILATGFRAQLNDWLMVDPTYFDERGLPKSPIGSGPYQGLYFLGYNNYAPGGGLGIIRQDAPKVVEHLVTELRMEN